MKKTTLAILLLSLVGACTSGLEDNPIQVVELYLQAKVEQDAASVHRLLCAEMEANYQRELHTFETVSGASIRDMNCQRRGQSDIVQCRGEIVAIYGGEQREFPLGAYRVVQENGEWKWCGEAE